MPWLETDPMTERAKFVFDIERGLGVLEACEAYGISEKTGHKWLKRYRAEGLDGLRDRSRRPLASPRKTADEVTRLVIAARRRWPSWGPKKLKVKLEQAHPEVSIPAQSTIGEILKRAGLVEPRKRRRRASGGMAHAMAEEPNQVWCADFKGEFRMGDGMLCYPLTVTDEASRYLLACRGLKGTLLLPSKSVFERTFAEYGLPAAIKTDNGSPFASRGAGGLTRLSVWLLRLGVRPLRIEKGKPQRCGRHERMHGTLKAATALPGRANLGEQQEAFDAFRAFYNGERPHEGLGQRCPGELYTASCRALPRRLPGPEYPLHWEKRLVASNGLMKFGGLQVFVGGALGGEWLGLEEVEESVWRVGFCGYPLGMLSEREEQFVPYGCTGGPYVARRYGKKG